MLWIRPQVKSTVDLFFVFSSTICLVLLPLPCKVSNSQSLTTVVGDFWLRPLLSSFTHKISSIRPGSLHSSDHIFFPQQCWAQENTPMALACLWRCIFCCLYFTWSIDLLGRSRKLHFASPCPLPQKFLFHMGLCCGFGVDNHRKQTAGLIHHQTGVMWV